ncbi:MAG: antibiotic biosynthesis monooxygenase [Deltaproteobacteria bacterium]|nr:antibiotic biosynthesis monooxygenase [Deltaproteobacteria bacterium]
MYLRLTFFKTRPDSMNSLRDLYNGEVIPAHKGHKGNRFVHLLERLDRPNEGISVTAWDTKADLDAYEKSGDYERILGRFTTYFAEPPRLEAYEVTASSEPILLRIF